MHYKIAISVLGVCFAVLANFATAQTALKEREPGSVTTDQAITDINLQKPMSFWMEAKLGYSKAILEDLTKGDFKKLAEDAKQMRLIGKMEGFVRRKSEDYRNQMQAFDSANRELIRQANRENAEGATSAFNQLTTSCVACHVLLREGIE